MGSNAFTFTFTERELSLLAEATEVVAQYGVSGSVFTQEDYAEMAARLDERLNY